ncbi:hypothetical protein EON65_11525 [archaeon]|nr:MAG: hypothetical protein EON65_11525 [archaeon]
MIANDNTLASPDISSFLANTNPCLTNTAISLAGAAYLEFDAGSQGSAEEDFVDVLPSKVYRKKLAVFAKKFIAKDTVIGEFYGYVKTKEEFETSSK